jgi:hypothetical protein
MFDVMPNWDPNWEDVQFDHAAAQDAANECTLAAGALDNAATGAATARTTLTNNGSWYGAHQVEFHVAEENLRTEMGQTRLELLELARHIADAANRARAQQVFRESERARWNAETAVEDQARADNPRNRNAPI